MNDVLVIGYGNTLRGDDGAGVIAAGRARDLIAGVDVITAHQLQPEHAEAVAGHRCVVFVDASVRHTAFTVSEVEARPGLQSGAAHAFGPDDLLMLAREVYHCRPERALLLEIPALSLDFGDGLTPEASASVETALQHIQHEAERFQVRV